MKYLKKFEEIELNQDYIYNLVNKDGLKNITPSQFRIPFSGQYEKIEGVGRLAGEFRGNSFLWDFKDIENMPQSMGEGMILTQTIEKIVELFSRIEGIEFFDAKGYRAADEKSIKRYFTKFTKETKAGQPSLVFISSDNKGFIIAPTNYTGQKVKCVPFMVNDYQKMVDSWGELQRK